MGYTWLISFFNIFISRCYMESSILLGCWILCWPFLLMKYFKSATPDLWLGKKTNIQNIIGKTYRWDICSFKIYWDVWYVKKTKTFSYRITVFGNNVKKVNVKVLRGAIGAQRHICIYIQSILQRLLSAW